MIPYGDYRGYLESLSSLGTLPNGHRIRDGCGPSELMSEIRLGATDVADGAAITFGPLLGSTPNFTFYRGRIPRSRVSDVSSAGESSTAGWPTVCSTCYYVGECVPSGGVCCSGTAVRFSARPMTVDFPFTIHSDFPFGIPFGFPFDVHFDVPFGFPFDIPIDVRSLLIPAGDDVDGDVFCVHWNA